MKSDAKSTHPSQREIDKCLLSVGEGDNDALSRLYDLTASSVYAYSLSLLRNRFDAEDVMHDVFVKVYETARDYKSHGKPLAWMLTIAKNMCYARFNQVKRIAEISDEDIERQFADDAGIDSDDKMVLRAALGSLSSVERQIVVLHAVSGMKHREIADMLGIPLSTTLSKYNRALGKLKVIIKE